VEPGKNGKNGTKITRAGQIKRKMKKKNVSSFLVEEKAKNEGRTQRNRKGTGRVGREARRETASTKEKRKGKTRDPMQKGGEQRSDGGTELQMHQDTGKGKRWNRVCGKRVKSRER